MILCRPRRFIHPSCSENTSRKGSGHLGTIGSRVFGTDFPFGVGSESWFSPWSTDATNMCDRPLNGDEELTTTMFQWLGDSERRMMQRQPCNLIGFQQRTRRRSVVMNLPMNESRPLHLHFSRHITLKPTDREVFVFSLFRTVCVCSPCFPKITKQATNSFPPKHHVPSLSR